MSNKYERMEQVKRISEELSITAQLAKELLILSGGDEELVIKCSNEANGLGDCRAKIIDARMKQVEERK